MTRRQSDSARWQEVIHLGEQLLSTIHGSAPGLDSIQAAILTQRNLILETTARLVAGRADLWLSEEFLPGFAGKLPFKTLAAGEDLFQPEPPSELMRCAQRTGRLCWTTEAETGQAIPGEPPVKGSRKRAGSAAAQENGGPTFLAAPLLVQENGLPVAKVLGVLQVERPNGGSFRDVEVELFKGLALQTEIALQSDRQMAIERWHVEQLSAVAEVSNAITSILDQDNLLNEVVSLIQKRFGYPFVHLFTVHPGRRKIFYEAGSGSRSQFFAEQRFSYDLDDVQGIIPWVARQAETVLANDVESEPRYRRSPLPPDETRSELTVPLIFGGEVLGVLDVQSDRMNAFGEDDRFLFEALADNIAIALRNATLYRSERWRRQVADSLREVAGLLSADADLDQVLDAILTELKRTIPSEVSAIWLLEDEGLEYGPEEQGPLLRLAAIHFEETLETEMNLEEALSLEGHALEPAEYAATWLTEALQAEHPVIRLPETAFDPLGAILGFPGDYSAIAAPLRVGEQGLGILTLAHHEPRRYGTEARAMTAAFASYASVAIENTRLYEAAHEQAWVSTVLLQVAEATQSLTNLNELLTTVVRITPMLAGVKACALYMLDDDNAFVPAAASELNSEQQAEFERWRFAPGDVPALDQILEIKGPLILQGEAEDPRLAGILFSNPDTNKHPYEAELLVLVPMQIRGEVLGVFLIDYRNDQPESSNLEALFDERLAILQGIAHQTAIAVENIRLLKAQKEEAYVSVALLQVAQVVVSSNDLNEILASIVRITPILVGVTRAAIYLWDAENSQFRLSQAYGMPRSLEPRPYTPGEFPLLDAARQEDRLLAYPLGPAQIDEDLVPDTWAGFAPPDPDETEEYLEEEPCLLLAFPLSVKGEALGVLLAEEPNPVNVESLPVGGTNLRLREKRLEIITGISQQAALAIQNDRLQREMVERERLEGEMQLAREIQRTFLPHELPSLPGWELDVRWRTAREVGGDFYDVFELPGGRLGLVISDVADKGMPAALFMTLVRTLVRATVQEVESPSEVLARVNDVLVPDAQQGMYVTLVYAVLEWESGKLTYANAGHNPPMLGREKSLETVRLEKGGMALGVLEGSRVAEHEVTLGVGEALIFYTDGITEAFSPDGEMYGEDCLRRTIQEAMADPGGNSNSAQHLSDSIETSVNAFLGGLPLADDLTLMVVRRMGEPPDQEAL